VEKSRALKHFPPAFPNQIENLADYYRFTLNGTGKVAGRVTQRIEITPKDNYRFGHHLWVDSKTGLLLQTHLINEQGQPIEQFVFTDIKYLDTIPDELLKPGVDKKGFTWIEAKDDGKKVAGSFEGMDISWLPDGFMEDMKINKKLPNSIIPVEQVVFSDGLASVSVFIEEEIEHDPTSLLGGTRMGALNVHGRTLGDYHLTVIGEVPYRTVKKISDSITNQTRQ
jgi:sigma-E factor negative regulatory protein RseB